MNAIELARMVVRGTNLMGCGCGSCRADAESVVEEPRSKSEEKRIRRRLGVLEKSQIEVHFKGRKPGGDWEEIT